MLELRWRVTVLRPGICNGRGRCRFTRKRERRVSQVAQTTRRRPQYGVGVETVTGCNARFLIGVDVVVDETLAPEETPTTVPRPVVVVLEEGPRRSTGRGRGDVGQGVGP